MIDWLGSNAKFDVYEGSCKNNVDEISLDASKAIKNLVNRLSKRDLLIVLISGS